VWRSRYLRRGSQEHEETVVAISHDIGILEMLIGL
jgi:hypothetical protein